MKLLHGKTVADKILSRIKSDIFLGEGKPGLAVILIGDDSASKVYVSLKEKKAAEIGVSFFRYDLLKSIKEDDVINRIKILNSDNLVNGIIVQLPLPEGFDTEKIIKSIDPRKDVDGFSAKIENIANENFGITPVFPRAILKLIESSEQEISGKKAMVIANSALFGKTMATILEQKGLLAEYILSNDIPSNLGKILNADVVISAVGSPGLLRGEMFKEGAVVIDGGIEKVGNSVVGDVDFASTEGKNGFLTPVPGGVGPVTIACLLENVYLAFKAQQKGK